ncbi:restriction endonuclease subunit S [Listeria monocytogenes]
MEKLEKSVPVIRFKGFSEAWEQRKLRDFTKISQGLQIAISDRYLENGDNRELYITNEFLNTYSSPKYYIENPPENVIANEDDILMTRTGNTGKVITNVIGAFHNNFFKIDYNPMKTSKLFLYYVLVSENIQKEILIKAGTSTIPDLKHNDFYSIVIQVPKIQEQQKIGDFFKQLDNTIALHQRKLDALKKMKKGFLQQMFPKSEEDVPKIRFTDFNGNWRQRKLEEVADRVRGNDRRMELPTLTISASKGWLNQHDRFFGNIAGKEQKNYTLLKKGQLSYNHGNSKSAKYGAVFVLRTYDEALVPRIYHSFKTNILANSDFIEYLFATKIPDRELRKIVSSGARMDGLLNINFNDFMSILIMLPFVEEQIKISNSLIRLDKIISLYQNKLDQLIKLKKAYLQYLFI